LCIRRQIFSQHHPKNLFTTEKQRHGARAFLARAPTPQNAPAAVFTCVSRCTAHTRGLVFEERSPKGDIP
jgi:hypothetical protein